MSCDKCGALKQHWRVAANATREDTGKPSDAASSLPMCSETKQLLPQSKIAAAPPKKHAYVRVKVESLALLLQQAVSSGLCLTTWILLCASQHMTF
jgi:hypothetical protein